MSVLPSLHAQHVHLASHSTRLCNEIVVRLGIPSTSNGGWWILTVVVQCTLIPITIGLCSPRGLVGMLADNGLLSGNGGDDSLGTHQHGDQCSGCPASMPNLAQLHRLCPGTTLGLAAWSPMLTRRCCSAKILEVSGSEGGKGCCTLSVAVY